MSITGRSISTALTAHPDFPGMEVPRQEAWGLVGRLPGTGDGPTLMLNGHIDVVPIGDPNAWSTSPFSGEVRDGRLFGRGACDMKAGLIAAHVAVQAVRRSGVAAPWRCAGGVGPGRGGRRARYVRHVAAWMASRRLRDPRADRSRHHPGQLGGADVPAARPRTGDPRRTPNRRCQRDRAVLAGVERARASSNGAATKSVDPLMSRWALAHPLSIGTVQRRRLGVVGARSARRRRSSRRGARRAGRRRRDVNSKQTVAEACADDPWLRDHPVEVEWWGGQFAAGQLPADSDLVDRVRAAHAGRRRRIRSTCTAHPTEATCDSSPGSAASRRSSTGPATPSWRTDHSNRSRSTRCSPRRARSPR